MVNVAVLLSAYNGDKFIKEQIESILNQNGVNVKLTIRNDGGDPEEKTRRIIREYVAKDERVSLLEGENLGCAKSFWQLLREAPEADYYAFADQDDVWLPDKLKAATDMLRGYDDTIPQLYCGSVRVVDSALQPIAGAEAGGKAYATKFPLPFIKSIAPGCTFVFNERARGICAEYVGALDIHDWMMTKIVSVFGEIHFDENAYILYRQHGNNEIGATGKISLKFRSVKNVMSGKWRRAVAAQNVLEAYGEEIEEDRKRELEILAEYGDCLKNKRRLLKDKNYRLRGFADKLGFRVCVLTGKL